MCDLQAQELSFICALRRGVGSAAVPHMPNSPQGRDDLRDKKELFAKASRRDNDLNDSVGIWTELLLPV